MPPNLSLIQETPALSASDSNFSPTKILINLAILIFLAEMVSMTVLYFIDLPSYVVTSLLDGIMMMVLILPGLYWLQLKPLVKQMQVRTQAEMALRANEELLKSVLELLPVGVMIINKDGEVIQGNPASEDIWAGIRHVGIPGYAAYEGWWADSGKQIEPEEWAAARAITRGETSLNEEITIQTFDGRQKSILDSAVPLLNENNGIGGAVVVNQDITRRRQMENELIQTNELMERFFSSIGVLIAYMDQDFNFIRVNKAYADSAGHPPEFFLGKNHFNLYPNPKNEAIFHRVVETGEPFSVLNKPFEYAEYPERGESFWDWSLQPVKGPRGGIQGVVLSLMDVTKRILAESQLTRQNQQLLILSEAERKQRELAESLVQATIALSSSLKLEEVLDAILEQLQRTIPFQMADISLIENGLLRVVGYRAVEGHPEAIGAMKKLYSMDDFPLWSSSHSTQRSFFIGDTANSPEWRNVTGMEWVRSFAAAPLIADKQVIGFINLTSDQSDYYDVEKTARLTAFAVPAALAIHNSRLYLRESKARQAAETLSAAAQALTQTLDLDEVINALLEYIAPILQADLTGVALLEGETRLAARSVLVGEQWTNTEQILSIVLDINSSPILQKVMSTHRSVFIPDTTTSVDWRQLPGLEPIRSWLAVPLVAGDKVIGVIGLGKIEASNFTFDQVQWAEVLAGQAAMAIQNAWLFQQVRFSSERLQSLARKLVELQESERYHIARELHDEAGQVLSSLKLSLGRLEQDPDCTSHIRQRLKDLEDVADKVLEDLHRLAMDLRPVVLDHLGLVAALEQFAGRTNSERLSVQFKAVGFDGARLPQDVETSLYRIVQEALTNVLRHAHANNVGILLERSGGRVRLFVEDDGIGFAPDQEDYGERLGLVGMRERAEMFGGSLIIESSSESGTSIIVEVPDVYQDSHRG